MSSATTEGSRKVTRLSPLFRSGRAVDFLHEEIVVAIDFGEAAGLSSLALGISNFVVVALFGDGERLVIHWLGLPLGVSTGSPTRCSR